IAEQTRGYLHARLPAVLPWLALAASRAFLQAHTVTRPLVVGVVVANVVNFPLTWLLVFGDAGLLELGLPGLGVAQLGTAGAGLASAVSTLVQLAIALAAVRAAWDRGSEQSRRPEPTIIRDVLRLGTPIGLTLLAEVGSFALVSVLMGNLGQRALASHNVAISLVSSTFQIALALGAAASVRVGHAIGRADAEATRRAGLTAIASGGLGMLLSAGAFVAIPRPLARILTDEPGVIEAAVPLLAVAAAFQLSDGVQAVAAGVLRGAGDTQVPLYANLAGHYAIGIPIGASLAWGAGWGAVGLWWGLSAGLTAVAILLTARFWLLSRRAIRRA
ncbi:MAG TPA: MATE family efflux transporter, partial [Polyangiaceae bacterium]|nr:MATE family efflux transporter [Polyangiaceae bacterium]